MQPEIHTSEDRRVTEFIERMNGAGDGPAARVAYREGFERLRSWLEMYPVSGERASVVFESAARTATILAAGCLPLGIAVAMHLYPICVLQCMPLPLLSVARFQRAMLLRTIRNRSLILVKETSLLGLAKVKETFAVTRTGHLQVAVKVERVRVPGSMSFKRVYESAPAK